MRFGFTKFVWGMFLLLAAVFVVANQINGFAEVGAWGIIAAIIAAALIVQCVASLNFAPLPLPLAILYLVFCETMGWPQISAWPLIAASILAWIGLGMLLPRKRWYHHIFVSHDAKRENGTRRGSGLDPAKEVRTENCSGGDNPVITVNFGAVSRRVHADSLETVRLNCNFGAIEAHLDEARLCPQGATAEISCSFGAVSLRVPKYWRVIDNLDCALGGVDIGKRDSAPSETAPTLTLSGNVSLGGVEVKYV